MRKQSFLFHQDSTWPLSGKGLLARVEHKAILVMVGHMTQVTMDGDLQGVLQELFSYSCQIILDFFYFDSYFH